jgi:hypothetical protein
MENIMQKATATYVAPVGDNKVVEMGGVTFFDGVPVDLNSYDHGQLIKKLEGNQYFDITVSEDDKTAKPPAKKRGRPSAADIAAVKLAADEADKAAKDAAEKAKAAKADHEAAEKAASALPPTPQTPKATVMTPTPKPPATAATMPAYTPPPQHEA